MSSIRRLGSEHVQDYRRIRLAALAANPEAFVATYEAEAIRSDAEHAERLATSVVFGAYVDGCIVGMLGCKRYDSARETHKAFLWGFYVDPAHRSCGIATHLLDASLCEMQTSVEQILLTVVATNRPAIALYERFGFRLYGTEPRSLKTSGTYTDEALMVLFLTDRISP